MWLALAAAVSHFSMVGFPVSTSDAATMGADVEVYARSCELTPLQGSNLLCVIEDKSGAELWVGFKGTSRDNLELFTFNPSLSGEGRTEIVVDGDVSPADWRPFEIRIQARFADDETPLILDLADPREAVRFAPKSRLVADITAFADEIAFHDSEAAYYAGQKDREIKFAANHFIPSGMFADGSGASKEPSAHALFAGKIKKMELRSNETGKAKYWWFLVETYDGAVFNVVADPSQVRSTPKIGGLLDGSFWLSARVAKD